MLSGNDADSTPTAENAVENVPTSRWTAQDVEAILRERGWLKDKCDAAIDAWLTDAAALLGPCALATSVERDSIALDERTASGGVLADLLGLIFQYDAGAIMGTNRSHVVLTRSGARTVIRELANRVLEGMRIDSERYKILVEGLQEKMGFSGRGLFHPIRLALAGRAGEAELDGVILLIDRAARLPFAVPVKGTRQRMLEFCAVMD
jgi:hypothetical protein